jgi:Fe-S cluster assembly protein SufD
MTQTLTERDTYVSEFEAFASSAEGEAPTWLRELRARAIDRFREVGLPTARKGNEPWKYTNVAPIAEKRFVRAGAATIAEVPAIVPRAEGWRRLVFVDGRYAPELSKPGEGLPVVSIREALASDGATVEANLGTHVSWEDDGFASLNTAFLADGAFIELPAETVIDEPVHLIYVSTEGDEPTVSWPRTLVIAGRHSKLTLIETYASAGAKSPNLTDAVTEIVLEDGSQVNHYRLLLENHSSYHVGKTRVHQRRDTTFASMTFEAGSALGRNDFSVLLDEPGGECHLNGLYITTGTQHIDNYLNIDHAKPHATSRLYYKGILDDASKAAFGGMVLVRDGAIKTDAHQEDKNLLLSDEAEVDSKPSLEIYADDVICGHGATAGAVTEEALFYMQSRGLDEESARVLLVKGFASEILERVKIDSLREQLERLTLDALPRFQTRSNDND